MEKEMRVNLDGMETPAAVVFEYVLNPTVSPGGHAPTDMDFTEAVDRINEIMQEAGYESFKPIMLYLNHDGIWTFQMMKL